LFHEEEKKEEVVGVVVGMEYLVSLADVGMQCFFRTRSRWGWNILCTLDVGMERVGIEEEEEEEEEEGNHLRKEPVSYCVNYKESVQ
jgi:alanine racemase